MLEVLQSKQQIKDARAIMTRQGRSALGSVISGVMRRLGLSKNLPVGDIVKSWDVARTLEFIEAKLSKNADILDMGAYCSEVPVALARMGFSNIQGVDLNPSVVAMPYSNQVKYSVSDFMNTPFASSSFDAITSISVIEHGYEPKRLFEEVARLLRPGGYFIASFDYWPDKINTGQTKFFGMSWLIFSKYDIDAMLDIAKVYGLIAEGPINPEANEKPIHCIGFDYTFGWLVLRKHS